MRVYYIISFLQRTVQPSRKMESQFFSRMFPHLSCLGGTWVVVVLLFARHGAFEVESIGACTVMVEKAPIVVQTHPSGGKMPSSCRLLVFSSSSLRPATLP